MSRRIAFDATVARLGRAGPAVYITALSRALAALLGERFTVLASGWAAPVGARPTLGDRARTLVRDLWWHQGGVTRAARRAGCDLLHLPVGLGPVRTRLPLVVSILDVLVLRFPHLFRRWHRAYAVFVLPRVARAARAVITISEASKTDIVERLGVAAERVTVIPPGVAAAFAPVPRDAARAREVRRRYGLPPRFVLAVGTLEPRKNLPRLFEAVGRAAGRPGAGDLALVHAGPPGWDAEAAARAARPLDGRAHLLGYVPPADLPALYSLAECLAYPSLWEGFGLPVAEAMACGCPVLTSRVSALPEVTGGGDAALLVDPTSTEEIGEGLARLWTDAALRERLAARGRLRAQAFTWERAAQGTAAVYDAALA